MRSAFYRALHNSHHTLRQLAGVKITYDQDGDQVQNLVAVPGQTPVELIGAEQDVEAQVRYTDWLIDPAQLILNGAATEPKRNATITVTDTESELYGATFRTTELPVDRKVWRYSDEHSRSWLRIHSLMTSDGADH